MANTAIVLIFVLGVLFSLVILAVFCLCMYLREFPRVKHKYKANVDKNIYETETEIDKSNVKIDEKKSSRKAL